MMGCTTVAKTQQELADRAKSSFVGVEDIFCDRLQLRTNNNHTIIFRASERERRNEESTPNHQSCFVLKL
jgi:hypothetical protein